MGSGDAVGKVVFCLCGPKGSLCCFILSLWGTLMLFLLGIFYYVEAVVLLEDFIESVEELNMTSADPNRIYLQEVTYYDADVVTEAYHKAAYSCWGASFIYLLFLILSGTFIGVNVWRSKVKGN